nr:outer dense fiber protein 4 isoform X1 [Oryctolagus cuniculus]
MGWGPSYGSGTQGPDKRPSILSGALGPVVATCLSDESVQKMDQPRMAREGETGAQGERWRAPDRVRALWRSEERDQHPGLGRAERTGNQDVMVVSMRQNAGVQMETPLTRYNSQIRRNSRLPFQWRITHSSRWMAQVLASELSLIAFLLLLAMVFSRRWLHPSGSRFHQRWPANVSKRIHTSIHVMSRGLLQACKPWSCSSSEHEKDSSKLWTNQPPFVVARIIFTLAVGVGFVLTIWLHLPYLPRFQRVPAFGLIGIILSVSEVTFIFSILMLFPVNLWLLELRKNFSVPIGWSYFLGWLVFVLYIVCAVLCYFNHKSFWRLILTHSSATVSCCSSSSSEESLSQSNISNTASNHEEFLNSQ